MKKQLNYADIIKEALILTGAVAIIAAAVYFFSGAEPYLCKQYLRSWYRVIKLCTFIIVCNHHDFECGTSDYWLHHLRTRIWRKNGLHQHRFALFLGLFEKVFPDFGSMTNSQELDVLCYILVVSVGLSILFNRNASSGGLDIVAKIMNKYLHMELGKACLFPVCVWLFPQHLYTIRKQWC